MANLIANRPINMKWTIQKEEIHSLRSGELIKKTLKLSNKSIITPREATKGDGGGGRKISPKTRRSTQWANSETPFKLYAPPADISWAFSGSLLVMSFLLCHISLLSLYYFPLLLLDADSVDFSFSFTGR